MSQRNTFVAIALSCIDFQYAFDDRCGWSTRTTDCSGLASGAAKRTPGYVLSGCPNSSAWARFSHNEPRPQWMNDLFGPDPYSGSTTRGWGITREQAKRTKGALGIRGDDQGQDGDGPKGHIKISLGDGRSIEAKSSRLDVKIWLFDSGDLDYFCIPPYMTGFDEDPGLNPGPATPTEAKFMGMIAMVIPGAHVQGAGPWKGRMPFIAAINHDDGKCDIVGYNGARLPAELKPTGAFGLSIGHLGKLNKPIEAVSVHYIGDPDDKTHDPPHLIPTREIVFLAGDGGTFGPYRATVKYGV